MKKGRRVDRPSGSLVPLKGLDPQRHFDAPKEGPLAGLLFFEDRSAPLLRLA
jgi:hypothetical protein